MLHCGHGPFSDRGVRGWSAVDGRRTSAVSTCATTRPMDPIGTEEVVKYAPGDPGASGWGIPADYTAFYEQSSPLNADGEE